jgi:fibronectin type 3 domain-containing protein
MEVRAKSLLDYLLRIVAIALIMMVTVPATFAQSAPAVISSVGYMNTNPQTVHTTASFNCTGASTVVVFVSSHPSWNGLPVSIGGLSDNLGNTYNLLTGPTQFAGSTYTLLSSIYYVNAPAASASQTLTLTLTNPAPLVIHAFAVAGSSVAGPPIFSPITSPPAGSTSASVASSSISVSPNSLLLGWVKNENPATATALGGYTLDPQSVSYLWGESQMTASGGSFTSQFQYNAAIGWQTAVVGLQPSVTPISFNQSVNTKLNVPLSIALTGSSPKGLSLTYSVVSGPAHGVLSGSAPNLTYTPNSGYAGSDSFTFRTNDGTTNSNTATVGITVRDPFVLSSVGYLNGTSLTTQTTPAFSTIGASTLVAFVSTNSPSNGLPVSISKVFDSAGNTWTLLAGPSSWAGSSVTLLSAIYYVNAPLTSANNTITVNLTNAAPVAVHAFAVAGSDPTVPPVSSVITSPATGTTSTQVTTAPITVTANNLMLAWVRNDATATAIAQGAYSIDSQSVPFLWAESQTAPSAGSFPGEFQFSGLVGSQSAVVALGLPGSSGPPPPPTPTITSAPTNPTNATTASFSFTDTQTGVSFLCQLDGSAFSACTSPTSYSGLSSGSHTFAVKAQSSTGSQSTAATFTWVVAKIAYVQSAFAVPQSPQTSVTIQYPAAQHAGDLNVVAVGWNDSTATVTSITDSSGNSYKRAVGPTVVTGFGSQSIYYAPNIAAAAARANTVTVTFSPAAVNPDIRILEYSGADPSAPVDATAVGTGNSATSSTASATTSNAIDVLFAANLVFTSTSGPGSGFTNRELTSPDGDIAEDRFVTAAGSYSGTAPLTSSGAWIMQMVAFRSPSTTATPSNLTATAISLTQINLSWTAPQGTTVANYVLQRCSGASCSSFATIATPTITTYSDTGLTAGISYSYRVQAIDTTGSTSAFSNVATATTLAAPTAPSNLAATAASTSQINLSWTASTSSVGLATYTVQRCQGAGCSNFAQVGSVTAPATTYSDTTLASSTSYSYRVQAIDTVGNVSAFSNVATAVTQGPPTAPGSLTAAASSPTQITLSWIASLDSLAISAYQVERCQGTGCVTFAQIAVLPPTTAYSDTGLSANTVYVYRVRAQDSGGNLSSYSNTATATTPAATIAYVQSAFAVPQSPQTSVTVTYRSAQKAGDLNVIAVGWNDSTATVTSVTDSSGNVYKLAVGPTLIPGIASQSIYYSNNIAAATANTNVVTVSFSVAAVFPDIRIAEYSGINYANPVDGTVANTGNSATTSAGPLTTTSPTDLLFAANLVQTTTTGAGTGFTARELSSPDGDIVEDVKLTATGSYTATAPLTSAGQWIMQMVAFRSQ